MNKKYIIILMICLLTGVGCSTPVNSTSESTMTSNISSSTTTTSIVSTNSNSSSKDIGNSSSTNTLISTDSSNFNDSTHDSNTTNTISSSSNSIDSKFDVSSSYNGNDDFSWGSMVWPD